jgi:type VI secretion system protein ImpH
MHANLPTTNLFRLVWRLERELALKDPVGTTAVPGADRIRFRQFPHLHHVAGEVAEVDYAPSPDASVVIDCYWPSLIGPNGPLPHFVTEQAIQERLDGGKRPLGDLLDFIGGRFIALFYRAWTLGTPAYGLREDGVACAYREALRAVHGPGPETVQAWQRERVSGFIGYPRSRAMLKRLLQNSFGLPTEIVQFVGAWLAIPRHARSRLGAADVGLGRGMVIGTRTWDRRYRFRVCFHACSFAKYLGFLPGQPLRPRLDALLRGFLRSHQEWDVDIELLSAEIPPARFGSASRLGCSIWLGKPRPPTVNVRLPKELYNPAAAAASI